MSLAIFRNIIQSLVLISCYSCNQHHGKDINKEENNSPNTFSPIKKPASIQYSTKSKTLNYNNWDTFWESFTTATRKKDTATIIALTNFPFFQNSKPTSQNEFLELWVSQSFDLRKVDATVLSSDIVLQITKPEKEILPKFDSVRYTYKNGKDFYFAKVNGYYRLVEIITPG
jgi:hypothetical protein